MKALTKTTNCTFRAKKLVGHYQKIFLALCAGLVPLPHFQLRSGATGDTTEWSRLHATWIDLAEVE